MSFFRRLFGSTKADTRPVALYQAIVAHARLPEFYQTGAVPDTVDGRFDMVATITALVLLRLERDGPAMAEPAARLTELFVDDMDGQLREMGIGDIVVGKHIGKMMALLGGRINALRQAFAGEQTLESVLVRNLYRDEPPTDDALAFTAAHIHRLGLSLDALDSAALIDGQWVEVRA